MRPANQRHPRPHKNHGDHELRAVREDAAHSSDRDRKTDQGVPHTHGRTGLPRGALRPPLRHGAHDRSDFS